MYVYVHTCITIYAFNVLFFAPTFRWSDLWRQQITQSAATARRPTLNTSTIDKYNLADKHMVVPAQAMKAYGDMDTKLHSIWNSVPENESALSSGWFTPVNHTDYQLKRWLGGLLSRSGHFGEQNITFFADWKRIKIPLLSNPSKPTASVPFWLCLETVIINLHETYQCRMYSRELLMMGREDARNM
jgi:hypothetical protein